MLTMRLGVFDKLAKKVIPIDGVDFRMQTFSFTQRITRLTLSFAKRFILITALPKAPLSTKFIWSNALLEHEGYTKGDVQHAPGIIHIKDQAVLDEVSDILTDDMKVIGYRFGHEDFFLRSQFLEEDA